MWQPPLCDIRQAMDMQKPTPQIPYSTREKQVLGGLTLRPRGPEYANILEGSPGTPWLTEPPNSLYTCKANATCPAGQAIQIKIK